MSELVVYDGGESASARHTYVGCIDGAWWRWPAEARGWKRKVQAAPADADGRVRYSAWHATLALALSGAPSGEGR